MIKSIPINLDKSPNVILEMVHRLKIRDTMSTNIVTIHKGDTFRQAQKIMKEKGITGLPVTEYQRLVGMISVHDIISALDEGYVEESVEKYMSKKIVLLEEDMPLIFAIKYFKKYPYRRFPVINKESVLVGMLTSRDILSIVLQELDIELEKIENIDKENLKEQKKDGEQLEFPIRRYDLENAGTASFQIKKQLKKWGVDSSIIRRISIASYELEINIVIHSMGGKMICRKESDRILITAADTGPGIPDTKAAVTEGFSTANEWIRSLGFGAGMGLPNSKKVADRFHISSEMDKGTRVNCEFFLSEIKSNHH